MRTAPALAPPVATGSVFGAPVSAEHRGEVGEWATAVLMPSLAPSLARLNPEHRFRRMVTETLDWLDTFDGQSYQDRWQASGADQPCTTGWQPPAFATHAARQRWCTGIDGLICIGVLRPSYQWLLGGRHRRLHALWPSVQDRAGFARLRQAAAALDMSELARRGAIIDLIRLSVRTGRSLAELSCHDLLDYRAAVLHCRHNTGQPSCSSTYHLARSAGLFDDGPTEFSALLTDLQRTPAQIVDHYRVASPTMRALLRDYLAERRPSIDYTTFTALAHQLCVLFWRDLETAHPGIDSHRLSRDQIEAWKQRLSTLPTGRPRRGVGAVLLAVRSFYLDINHWAHDHPEHWAQWAAPVPVTRQDVRAANRNRRAETARMHGRVREFAPRLPDLVCATRSHRDHTAAVLVAATAADPGQDFDVDGQTHTRLSGRTVRTRRLLVRDPAGDSFDAVFAEDEAFWSWAMIEVLRHTGIRIEELLELTHHSIRPYRQHNGEIVPLLQIAPSKTDAERVIPASPALASVLAQIVTRVAGPDGTIPLTSRHDEHERTWSHPQPHLFIHHRNGRPRAFTDTTLREYLNRTLTRAGWSTQPRQRITPHDFRRLFTTEAVNGGLPIHIAAAVLGHHDLNTTLGYTAIYPREVFDRYQQFLTRRRSQRPTDEYRAPTAAELAEFSEHFGTRKIELGTCARPYASPCIHEHACLRCPFQQIDPDQMPRLNEIENSIRARIDEARNKQWLGDVDQLEATLDRLRDKRNQLTDLLDTPTIPLGR